MSVKSRFDKWKKEHKSQLQEYRLTLHYIRKSPLTMSGLIIIVVVFSIAIFAPLLATHNPRMIDLKNKFLKPSFEHFFGTDAAGMDIYSKVVYGTRYDLYMGLLVVALAGPIGSILGIFAGYQGGKIDGIIMRIVDIVFCIPSMILAMAIMAALNQRSLTILVTAIASIWWVWYARLARGITLSLKEERYVEAAKAAGASDWYIMLVHILPNTIGPLIVNATLDIGTIILSIAALNFLGLGAEPGVPEWGRMVSEGRNYLRDYPWITTFPGLAILFTCLGFNLLGDGIRDVLDPRLRRG